MSKFLDAVAAHYTGRYDEQDFDRFTFVFPNQRSQLFFRSALEARRPEARPLYLTMAELMEKTAGLSRADANELIVWLYVAYCRVRRHHHGDEPETFDRFRYWGEMLLRDFDEVDRYMVDRTQLFKNVRDFKVIQSSYLTPEQLEIIKTYWGEDPYWGRLDSRPSDEEDMEERPFWLRMGSEKSRFPMLWEILSEVYQEFHKILAAHRKCYPGMAFRIAAERVRQGDLFHLGRERTCVFIGFSDLSTSELSVMRKLHLMRKAEFFWDYDPALMSDSACPMAGRFVGNYIKQMPPPVELLNVHAPHHSVDIISCPTNAGQVPMALDRIRSVGSTNCAVVLPSEDLLLPLLSQVDCEEFPSVCVSMSYPQRLTDVASLFSAIVTMQLRLVRRSDREPDFFRKDVMAVLSHPIIANRYADDAQRIVDYLADNHIYNMPSQGAPAGALAALFTAVTDDASTADAARYVEGVLEFIAAALADEPARGLDRTVCRHLIGQSNELCRLMGENPEVTMRRNTFFHLIESALFRRPIQLTAPHVHGLQILGMLETRSLSFSHVVMLSMSDRVFPGRRATRSFVPVTLRRAFGMPTPDVAESHMAYHFYRLLSHAEKMTLIFDSRSGGLRSGDMSRFLYQLRFLDFSTVSVTYRAAAFNAATPDRRFLAPGPGFGVEKTDAVMQRLMRFRHKDHLHSNALSASALKKYLNCPLSFYLEYVADIKVPDEYTDDINDAVLGSAFHAVAENVYNHMRLNGMNPIDRDKLTAITESPVLEREIVRAINAEVKRIARTVTAADGLTRTPNPELDTPLSDEDYPLAKLLAEMWQVMVRAEPPQFEFMSAEYSKRWQWTPLPGKVPPLNFTMKIDRIDRVNGCVRLVDYKTGSDELSVRSVDALLDPSVQDRHAIFQLMLYCCAYADANGDPHTPVQPLIYKMKKLASDGVKPITIDRRPLSDYHIIEDEFRQKLAEKINELFDPEVPFCRCDGSADKECRYCKFQTICGV